MDIRKKITICRYTRTGTGSCLRCSPLADPGSSPGSGTIFDSVQEWFIWTVCKTDRHDNMTREFKSHPSLKLSCIVFILHQMRMVIGYYTEDYPSNFIPWEDFSPFEEAYFDNKVTPMVGDVIMSRNGEYYEVVKRIFKIKKENGYGPILCLHLIMRKTEVEKLEDL